MHGIRLVAILLATSLYTFIRYVMFGHVSPEHIPVFLLNKSIAMASVLFLCCTAYSLTKKREAGIHFWGSAALHTACIHACLSLSILSSAYYPKFFDTAKMNITGELSIMFGVFALYGFWLSRGGGTSLASKPTLQWLTALLVAGHLVAMGLKGWLTPEKWHGSLPPISLISLIFVTASLLLFLKAKKKHTS